MDTTTAPTACWYCGQPIEYREGFGWRVVGTVQGYTCPHTRHGQFVQGEGHEPEATR